MTFYGYRRRDGAVGIRNQVLIIPNGRGAGTLCMMISRLVNGVTCYIPPNENGRTSQDRATIARVLVGLCLNANVGGVLIVGNKPDGGYPEFSHAALVETVHASGKPVETHFMSRDGGFHASIGEAVRKARKLVLAASQCQREPMGIGDLHVSVKCGYSDATSGISGNPVVGHMFDRIVQAGGTALFSETTEVIGAEHMVAQRFVQEAERRKFLAAVEKVEEDARATGEDIRTINPIPANIQAGLSTLEEKSLGAIAKGGTMPIEGCLAYGERPCGRGLYYMDSWMSSTALFLGFTATGSVLNIFQMGGGWFAQDAMMPTANTGLVAPTMYMTGNPRTAEKAPDEIDFSSGSVITENESIEAAGERLLQVVCTLASGGMTKVETLRVHESIEMYLQGPGL